MYKKMISLTAIMAMIVTLVMPARAYADETQAESQQETVLKADFVRGF